MVPKPKFSRVKLKAYELTDAYENRKFVFPFSIKCIFVNDGGKLRFFRVGIKPYQGKNFLYSFFETWIKISL